LYQNVQSLTGCPKADHYKNTVVTLHPHLHSIRGEREWENDSKAWLTCPLFLIVRISRQHGSTLLFTSLDAVLEGAPLIPSNHQGDVSTNLLQ